MEQDMVGYFLNVHEGPQSLSKYNFKHFYLDFSMIMFATLYGYVNFNYFNMHRYAFSITLVYIIVKLYFLKKNYESKY